jgi:hypothetical protein
MSAFLCSNLKLYSKTLCAAHSCQQIIFIQYICHIYRPYGRPERGYGTYSTQKILARNLWLKTGFSLANCKTVYNFDVGDICFWRFCILTGLLLGDLELEKLWTFDGIDCNNDAIRVPKSIYGRWLDSPHPRAIMDSTQRSQGQIIGLDDLIEVW